MYCFIMSIKKLFFVILLNVFYFLKFAKKKKRSFQINFCVFWKMKNIFAFLICVVVIFIAIVGANKNKNESKLGYQKIVRTDPGNTPPNQDDGYEIDISHQHSACSTPPGTGICKLPFLEGLENGCFVYTKGYDITSPTYILGVKPNMTGVCDCIDACLKTRGCVTYSYKYTGRTKDQPRDCVLSMGLININVITGKYKTSRMCTRSLDDNTWDQDCYSGIIVKWPDGKTQC